MPESSKGRIYRKILGKYEQALDEVSSGPVWLKKTAVALIVEEALHCRDTIEYDLYAYSIMSNHVHLVFRYLSSSNSPKNFPVTTIMQSLSATAFEVKGLTLFELNPPR